MNDEASRRQMRQQRKALKKQKLLATKQQFSRNVFSADDPDPDLFTYSKETQSAFEKEDPLVDASLLLTGGEPDTADPHAAFLDTVVLPSESSGDVKEVDCMPDMGSVDRSVEAHAKHTLSFSAVFRKVLVPSSSLVGLSLELKAQFRGF